MTETVLLKLGGSVITDKTGDRVFHADRVRALGAEILDAMGQRPMRLLIGHGAGCFGHVPAKQYRVREGLAGGGGWRGYAVTRRAVITLNGLMLDAFGEAGLFPVFVQPSASAVADRGVLQSMDVSVIKRLLDLGQVPMVCGDAVLDEERGFTIVSTERFFAWLAHRLRPSRIVLACDVDGVFEADPVADPGAKRIERVDGVNMAEVLDALGRGLGPDVTGGMAGKVRAMHTMADANPTAEIRVVSGLIQGRVRDALLGQVGGTVIRP